MSNTFREQVDAFDAMHQDDTFEVVGLVSLSGLGGGKLFPDKPWNMLVKFTAWRLPDGTLHQGTMYASRPVMGNVIRELRPTIRPNSIIRIRAKWKGDVSVKQTVSHVHFIEFLSIADDSDLSVIATDLARPVTITVRPFGKLTLDRRFSIFNGEASWGETKIKFDLPASNEQLSDEIIKLARSFFKPSREWDKRLRAHAAEQLLDLKNDTWADEDGRVITSEEFISRLEPESVSLSLPDAFNCIYRDGELFFGHVIMINGTLADGPSDVSIAG